MLLGNPVALMRANIWVLLDVRLKGGALPNESARRSVGIR
jgi:hypothetical protein